MKAKNDLKVNYNHYKEVSPIETVKRLKNKLNELGIEVDEILPQKSRIGTNSLRVVFKGTNVGANGKGINEDFCRASAYAELFERLENDYLNKFPQKSNAFEFMKCPDEKKLTAEELILQDDPFLRQYFKDRSMEHKSIENKIRVFRSLNSCHGKFSDSDKYLCLPFYDIRSEKVYYLPLQLYTVAYGSNGMAAGNTPEEAIVQGLSEVIERVVQKEIITNPQSLPTITDELMREYSDIYQYYKNAQNYEGIKAVMKDCSLGGKYPVAGLLLIEENTGKFGLKLGCHPNGNIAIERTLTEATQGGEIDDYARRSTIDFTNNSVNTKNNLMNSFATGLAQYPYQIMIENSSSKFSDIGRAVKSNKTMMIDMIRTLLDDGYDVLVRDVSWLDFPAYHIIVPGLSETTILSDECIRAFNTLEYVKTKLKSPSTISKDDCKYINGTLGYFKGNVLIDTTNYYFHHSVTGLPYKGGILSTRYLSAICDVYCGNYKSALKKLEMAHNWASVKSMSDIEKNRYNAEIMYLSAYNKLSSHEKVMLYLEHLLNKDMYELIDYLYREPDKILAKIYPAVSESKTNEEVEIMHNITNKLKEAMLKADITQSKLRNVFTI